MRNFDAPWTRLRRVIVAAVVLVGAIGAGTIVPSPAASAPEVQDEFVAVGMRQPTAIDWLANGKALVVGKIGDLYVLDAATGDYDFYFQIPNTSWEDERGALDVLIDPATDEVFLYRSLRDTSQLVVDRFTFTGDASVDAASLTRVWSNPGPLHSAFGTHHLGGGLAFGPGKSTIFVSIGDGERPANAQDMTNVFGKVLRINRDGSVPADNPFHDGAGSNIDEIYAHGLRNPFRIWSGANGVPWVGDVGGNDHPTAYEEIHRVTAGANYGWPMCQGPNKAPKNGPECPSGVAEPAFFWAHPPNPDQPFLGAAVAIGERISGNLPPELEGSFVYADYAKGTFSHLRFAADGSVQSNEVLAVLPRFPVWLGRGPDGHLYYIDFQFEFDKSQIRRLRIQGVGSAGPSIGSITATPTSGTAPLSVSFAADVTDPLNRGITYAWDFGDDHTTSRKSPTHVYREEGTFAATLRVTAGGVTTVSAPVTIAVGNAPTASAFANVNTFRAGETITFTGSGSGGTPPLALKWDLVFGHDDHAHPVRNEVEGPSLSFTVPTTGHDYQSETSYRAVLTVTDANGLQAQQEVVVAPEKVDLIITSDLPGATFRIDGETRTTPAVIDSLVGFQHTLEGPPPQEGVPEFSGWSDEASLRRQFTVPPDGATLNLEFGPSLFRATTVNGMVESPDFVADNAEVLRLYQAVFNREPDVPGAKYWIRQQRKGLSINLMALFFTESEEFQTRYGKVTTNSAFLDLVYRNALDREPDAPGKRYWSRQLSRRRLTRGEVVRWFSNSEEFRTKHPYGFPPEDD